MKSLNGKRALVTGGASGIGKAVTQELAGGGAQVFIHYHTSHDSAAMLAELVHREGGAAHIGGADLTREEEVERLFREVEEKLGGLDILVNNAGDLVGRARLEELDLELYRKILAVNLDSLTLVTRRAIPLLRAAAGGSPASGGPGGSIVNLSSLAGRKGGHGGSLIYSAAKGAVLAFTRALAAELAPDGIRVNAVAPGLILGSRFHAVHTTEESKRRTIEGIPLGRAGTCEDVARAVAFLAAETDGFITGATLDLNGGVYMA